MSSYTNFTNIVGVDAANSPYDMNGSTRLFAITENGAKLTYTEKEGLEVPKSLFNNFVGINYRTIENGFLDVGDTFTKYCDYKKCMDADSQMREYLEAKKNPTYQNILKYYSDKNFDPYGLASYKPQDFLYCKYFNQIPNNYMLTLRRYSMPCRDRMFGLDMSAMDVNRLNNYPEEYMAMATAVTYMGEQTGNKLSDILSFSYGSKWNQHTAAVEALQSPDGGLAAQMKGRLGINEDVLSGQASWRNLRTARGIRSAFLSSALTHMKGVSTQQAIASQYKNNFANEFQQKYGDELWGDLNVVDTVLMRERGLSFTNNFSLNFEYSLKSFRYVNPRVAMLDILTNFLFLTGNYGSFWGGETIFYGANTIASQFGDPSKLRSGDPVGYVKSLADDLKQGWSELISADGEAGKNIPEKITNFSKNVFGGGFVSLLNNIFGGNIGVPGQSQIPKALLTGEPTGFWHLTVGNPLDPIAMMGNMAVKETTVQFNDILGYDDFPTEVKFTVNLEHCMPRDNAHIESMFNAGKGRIYAITDKNVESMFNYVNEHKLDSFKDSRDDNPSDEVNVEFDEKHNVSYKDKRSNNFTTNNGIFKFIGGYMNKLSQWDK